MTAISMIPQAAMGDVVEMWGYVPTTMLLPTNIKEVYVGHQIYCKLVELGVI